MPQIRARDGMVDIIRDNPLIYSHFELLVRQVTSDILSNRKSIAEGLLKKYFNSKTELVNELKLYQFIVYKKYNNENRAERN